MNVNRPGKIRRGILIVLGLTIAPPISGAGWILIAFRRAVAPTTSLDRYAEAISPQELEPPQQAIFPTMIPAQATGVAFYYQPHFLQGNAIVHLRFKAGSVFEALRTKAKSLPPTTGPTTQESKFPPQIRTFNNEQFEDLPPDFEVWYYWEFHGSGGNDLFRAMVAGSAKRREIVYVAE